MGKGADERNEPLLAAAAESERAEGERRLMRAARETLKCRLHVHAGSAREPTDPNARAHTVAGGGGARERESVKQAFV